MEPRGLVRDAEELGDRVGGGRGIGAWVRHGLGAYRAGGITLVREPDVHWQAGRKYRRHQMSIRLINPQIFCING